MIVCPDCGQAYFGSHKKGCKVIREYSTEQQFFREDRELEAQLEREEEKEKKEDKGGEG